MGGVPGDIVDAGCPDGARVGDRADHSESAEGEPGEYASVDQGGVGEVRLTRSRGDAEEDAGNTEKTGRQFLLSSVLRVFLRVSATPRQFLRAQQPIRKLGHAVKKAIGNGIHQGLW